MWKITLYLRENISRLLQYYIIRIYYFLKGHDEEDKQKLSFKVGCSLLCELNYVMFTLFKIK